MATFERLHVRRAGSGHDFSSLPMLQGVGIFYTVLVCVYTLAIVLGLCVFFKHRRAQAVRIRGVGPTFVAVLLIYSCAAAIFIVYPLNGRFSCGSEFWIMSVPFPLGIALFQGLPTETYNQSTGRANCPSALNVRLWLYHDGQEKFKLYHADKNKVFLNEKTSNKPIEIYDEADGRWAKNIHSNRCQRGRSGSFSLSIS